MSDELKIYVACLASYNSGILHGRWIDISDGLDDCEIEMEIQEMLETSPSPGAEEWAIHDWETPVRVYNLGEHHSLGELETISRNFAEYGNMFLYIWEHMGGPVDNMRDYCENSTIWSDWDEIIDGYLETFDVKPPVSYYIDEDKLRRDLEINGTYIETDDRIVEIHG